MKKMKAQVRRPTARENKTLKDRRTQSTARPEAANDTPRPHQDTRSQAGIKALTGCRGESVKIPRGGKQIEVLMPAGSASMSPRRVVLFYSAFPYKG